MAELSKTSGEEATEHEVRSFFDEICESKLNDRTLWKVAGKGALLGALGGVIGAGAEEIYSAIESDGLGGLVQNISARLTSFVEGINVSVEIPEVQAAGEPATDLETFASEPDLNTTVPIPEVTQIPLDAGSNPWGSVEAMLEDRGIQPTNAQMLELMKVVSTESGISVPEWGISGESFVDHQQLPEGFQLEINADAERLISQMAQARSQ